MSLAKTVSAKVLDFWYAGKYATPAERNKGALMKMWWQGDAALDAQIKAEFEDYLKDHLTFKEEMKGDGPHSTLAYILLTDQFPRNMYRNDPRAFATDVFAREATFHALEQGWDKQLDPSSRMFLYLPLEHSENMEHQLKCLEKMAELERDDETGGSKGLVGFATEHSDLIKRFGRFPHRNALLGRENTAEEAAFLEEKGGSMFGQGKKEEKKE